MCYYSVAAVRQAPEIEMSEAVASRIEREILPRTYHLFLSCATEPFMAKRFDTLYAMFMSKLIPDSHMITNGTLLTEKRAELLVETQLAMLEVSVDGATKETYERIRRGAKFETVIKNIKLLQAIKRKHKSTKPAVMLNFVMQPDNIDELLDFIDLAAELQVDSVNLIHQILFAEDCFDNESLFDRKNSTNKVLQEARQHAAKLGVFLIAPPDFAVNEDGNTINTEQNSDNDGHDKCRPICINPWREIYISADGSIFPCTFWMNQPPMGSLTKQSFREIWNCTEYRKLRNELSSGNLRHSCLICPCGGAGKGNLDDSESHKPRAII